MRTRRGLCYPEAVNMCAVDQIETFLNRRVEAAAGEPMGCRKKVKFSQETDGGFAGEKMVCRKKAKFSQETDGGCDFLDALPDDLVLCILGKLSSTAVCPSDFVNILITCKRLNGLGLNPVVLSKASRKMLSVKAENWSESAHRFLKLCADTGNAEACFTLGMIRFYCLQNRGSGASLMAKAAIASHAPALYSLAVIQFNGSGGSKNDKDLRAGVALCARAAFVGHIDALRELGHCLQDGYGVKKNIAEGRRFLIQANARELATVLVSCPSAVVPRSWLTWNSERHAPCPLLSDFGCNVPAPAPHPANEFLSEWFSDRTGNVAGPGLRLCSHSSCGRPETRRHEFRRCSVCGAVNYCSRACQALDWKLRHKAECAPVERWADADVDGVGVGDNDANGDVNEDQLMEDS